MNEYTKRIVCILTIVLINVIISAFILKSPTIFQEGNPLKVLVAVMKLELTGVDAVKFSENPEKYIFKTGRGIESLSSCLGREGWRLNDQMGTGVFYERDNETLSGTLRMFTRYFMTFEVRKRGEKKILHNQSF